MTGRKPMFVYSDEDNAPMIDSVMEDVLMYGAERRDFKEEPLPFTDPAEPEPHVCGNCDQYNGTYCTKYWNNMDDTYLDRDRDRRLTGETCDEWSCEYGFSLKDS